MAHAERTDAEDGDRLGEAAAADEAEQGLRRLDPWVTAMISVRTAR